VTAVKVIQVDLWSSKATLLVQICKSASSLGGLDVPKPTSQVFTLAFLKCMVGLKIQFAHIVAMRLDSGFHCGHVSSGIGSEGSIVDDSDGDESPMVSNTSEEDDWLQWMANGLDSNSPSGNDQDEDNTDDILDFVTGVLGDGPI